MQPATGQGSNNLLQLDVLMPCLRGVGELPDDWSSRRFESQAVGWVGDLQACLMARR